MTPRAAFGVTPLGGGRHLRPGKASSAVPWGWVTHAGTVRFMEAS